MNTAHGLIEVLLPNELGECANTKCARRVHALILACPSVSATAF